MCIIIYKPADASLKLSTVLRAYQRNDDGWGIAAYTPTGLVIRRDFGRDADETLLDSFDELRQYEMVLHCRIGTSGDCNLANTHPFNVTDDIWLFHNGVIKIDRSADPAMCDSYHVAASLVTALGEQPSEALRDKTYLPKLAKYADTSRLVFADSQGVVIVNEKLGYWEDGCWFSNDSADPICISRTSPTGFAIDGAAEEDDALFERPLRDEFAGDYFDGYIPRCYRVETQEDADALYSDALAFIDDLRKLDVDELAARCLDNPEMMAEAMFVLVNSRQPVA